MMKTRIGDAGGGLQQLIWNTSTQVLQLKSD